MGTFKANMTAQRCYNYIQVLWQIGPLLVSQLAPKYPWRQRHSLGRTHTSFSLQVKFPSQRADGWRATCNISHRRSRDTWRVSVSARARTCQAFVSELRPSATAHQSHRSERGIGGEIKSYELTDGRAVGGSQPAIQWKKSTSSSVLHWLFDHTDLIRKDTRGLMIHVLNTWMPTEPLRFCKFA